MFRRIGELIRKQGNNGDYLEGTLDLGPIGQLNVVVFFNNKVPDCNIADATIHLKIMDIERLENKREMPDQLVEKTLDETVERYFDFQKTRR